MAYTHDSVVSELIKKYITGNNAELIVDEDHKALFNNKEIVGSNQLGIFESKDTSNCNIPISEGLIILTGDCKDAGAEYLNFNEKPTPGSNMEDFKDSAFYFTYNKYCIEHNVPTMSMHDIGCLSFWIKPKIENLAFSYCFASNEYPKFVGMPYNDFFGFYLSGPFDQHGNQIIGATNYSMQNLALIPGTTTPVMINTVNHGKYIDDIDHASYPEYHIQPDDNCHKNCQMKQYTKQLSTAIVQVLPEYYYKIEIYIADINDYKVNSALFLASDMRRFDTIVIDTAICDDTDFYFGINNTKIDSSGTYSEVFKNIEGGDSLVIVNLSVKPTEYTNICWRLKQGDTLNLNGIKISKPGTYISHLKTYLGCDSTVVFNVQYGDITMEIDCLSVCIEDINKKNDINVFPNPAKNFVTIESDTYPLDVVMYNQIGQKVKQVSVNENERIYTGDLARGIYYLNIKCNNVVNNKLLILK
ncbi:MAG: T9SS type A sorting domain-containing protein [Bacteroidales bacterium]|nr:T9SS type A sorting domain-containing protein [Bacteroidales bacterium]